MNYPLISEYKEAIRAAEENFDELKNLRPVLDEDGEPVMTSGNFAVVFKMKNEQTGKLHAVKCFLKEQEGRAEAYRQIAEELEYVNSTFLTPIKYMDKELFVDSKNSDETEFPVLLMDWVEGMTLDKYIREHIDDQYELSLLAYQFSRLAMWLMPQPFAHGDLKPDNILVKDDGTLVLVDYDGMYVPAMKGQKARELGSPDFQHPNRKDTDFDEHIDDFSLACILLSLKAIALQPSLLGEYGASDRLLFSEKDYRNLSGSSVLDALKPLMQDAELASLYSLYILALSQNNLSHVSFRLFNLSRPDKSQYEEENLSTEVTDEDLANVWTDEYGVKYSADRKRLLKAPQGIKEYTMIEGVKVVCDEAFREAPRYHSIQSVIIPDSVVKIGNSAFRNCVLLSNINISFSLLYIGANAFSGCIKLRKIHIPNSVSYIGCKAFRGCELLTDVNIPNALSNIESEVFAGSGVEYIKIPPSVKSIGFFAFARCEFLEKIDIPDSVVSIGNGAFSGCSSLGQIKMSSRITEIGVEVFRGCAMTNFTIPNCVTKIGNRAFWDCSLEEITIPRSVTTIEEGAFYGCPISKVTLPCTILKIEDETFCECFALKQVVLPNSIREIGNAAFYNCSSLTTINLPNSLTSIGNEAFGGCESIETISIPKNVIEIGDNAFTNCDWLEEVTFDGPIPHLWSTIFSRCDNLLYINVCKGIKKEISHLFSSYTIREQGEEIYSLRATDKNLKKAWIDEFGVKYSQDKKRLLEAPESLNNYSIKKGTKVICNEAFCGCKKLELIDIPDGVIAIGDFAFSDCNLLKSISLPNSITKIGESTFFLAGIQKAELPNKLINISARMFCFCSKLSSITIPDSIEMVGYEAFRACNSLTSITIPKNVKVIEDSAFLSCKNLTSVKIDNGSLKIDPAAFAICSELSTLIIPFGTINWFTELLPELKDKFVESEELRFSPLSVANLSIIEGSRLIYDNKQWVAKCNFVKGRILKSSLLYLLANEGVPVEEHSVQTLRLFGLERSDGFYINPEVLCFAHDSYSYITKISFDSDNFSITDVIWGLHQNMNEWRTKAVRSFTIDELAAVARTEVVPSQYGNSVCFFMKAGGQTYIPLQSNSSLTVGDSVDLKTAKIVTLCCEGKEDVYRVIE